MNRTKIEMYDYTWNPCFGCLHPCTYCYGKGFARRFNQGDFSPTFYPEKLQEPLRVKKPSRIFVGSMADLFGNWRWKLAQGVLGQTYTRKVVVEEILEVVEQCPQHTFIFLTKNPRGMQGFDFPANCWCGTSVEDQSHADKRIPELLKVNCKTLICSYEPALGPIDFGRIGGDRFGWGRTDALNGLHYIRANPTESGCEWETVRINRLKWLIIGAQTGPGAVKPDVRWITHAIAQAMNADIPVFAKDNLGPIAVYPRPQEWPE